MDIDEIRPDSVPRTLDLDLHGRHLVTVAVIGARLFEGADGDPIVLTGFRFHVG